MWDKLVQILFRFMFDKNLMYLLPPVLFNLSLTASIVIVAVLLVRQLLRKAPRVYSYVLWAVVAFRLICPVSFSSGFSLLNIVNAPAGETGLVSGMVEYVPVNIVHTESPAVDLLIPAISEAVNEQLPQSYEQLFGDPLELPAALASWVWMFGFSIMLLWALSSYLSLHHKLRTAVLLEGNVFQSEHVGSPFILGLFRPKIYIPFGLDESTLKYVLAHEKYHIKRLDHIVKVFAFILLTIHWFNPLCWLAFHLMSKDMEMSCDEKVLSKDNNVRTEYSSVLLSFASNRRFPAPSPLAFGETGAKSRIKNALKWKRPKVWVTLIAAILCIAVIAACAANPKEKDSSEVEPYDWTSTVKQDDIYGVSIQLLNTEEPATIDLSSDDIRELVTCLNKVTPADFYTGRGIPAQIKVIITLSNEETVILHYGTTYIEILYPGITSSDGIWMIRDTELKSLLSEWSVQLQQQYNSTKSSQEDTITAAMTLWEYAPLLSSRYPAFPFQFTFPYTRIEATCTAGELIGYDDHDGSSYPTGTSLTVPSGSKLYWLPMGNGKTDPLYASSASISFTAYDDSKPTYSGTLNISQLDTDHKSDFIWAVYGATLSSSSLMMYQNPTDYGGVIYSVSIAATGGSDLPESTFIQNTSLSETRAAALDQRFQKDVVPNNFSCHSHEVLTWHTSRSDGQNTLAEYLLVYYAEYNCSSSGVSLLHEETVPVIMVYGMDANNAYTLLDYRELTDEEVWAQFPLAYVDEALDKDRKNQTMAPACYAAALEYAQSSENSKTNGVTWEFGTAFSSLYPGFPFEFTNFAYSHIEATCSAGQLVNEQTGEKGQSMTFYAVKQTLYWTPYMPDSTNVSSAVIQFTAYNNDKAVFSGNILIEQTGDDPHSLVYSARLSAGGELTLRKNITGNDGGLIYRIPVHNLTESGPVQLGAHLLRYYHFKTNSTKIYFEFDPDIEPFTISLYSTDSETALSSFSLGGGNLASFSVSGLSPDREYYFVAERQIYTLLTIHN